MKMWILKQVVFWVLLVYSSRSATISGIHAGICIIVLYLLELAASLMVLMFAGSCHEKGDSDELAAHQVCTLFAACN